MASGYRNRRKCFTFIWKVENVSDALLEESAANISPDFIMNCVGDIKWRIFLISMDRNEENLLIAVDLIQEPYHKGKENVEIDFELAFLQDGRVVQLLKKTKRNFLRNEILDFNALNHFLFVNVPAKQDNITIQCRVWKSVGEFSEEGRCVAHTRFERSSFLWQIKNFSALEPNVLTLYDINLLNTRERFVTLGLILTEEGKIRFSIIRYDGRIYISNLLLSLVDYSGNIVESLEDGFRFDDANNRKEFEQFFEKVKLLEKKDEYLPSDILSLRCKYTFGIVLEKNEKFDYVDIASANLEPDCILLDRRNMLSSAKRDLIDNFKSMLNNGCHSDIKLRTGSKTFPVHKCVLSTRSPVFKAMFEKEMKENINRCVGIKDLSDDTVLRMLQYIYSADVEELEWDAAIQLYEAADKYEILSLKDICSSYLKNNLQRSNVCEALVLADLHQDEDLKGLSQNFILRHGEDIINSEDWKKMMLNHLKLAAETMRLKFKK